MVKPWESKSWLNWVAKLNCWSQLFQMDEEYFWMGEP